MPRVHGARNSIHQGRDQLPGRLFKAGQPVERINRLIAFAQVMNSASPTLLRVPQSGRHGANRGNGNISRVTRSQGRAVGVSVRDSSRPTCVHTANLGRATISGPVWSTSPRRPPRSPYCARSRGVDATLVGNEIPLKTSQTQDMLLVTALKLFRDLLRSVSSMRFHRAFHAVRSRTRVSGYLWSVATKRPSPPLEYDCLSTSRPALSRGPCPCNDLRSAVFHIMVRVAFRCSCASRKIVTVPSL